MKVILRNPRHQHEELIVEATTNVVRLEANLNYTLFVMFSGKSRIMSYTLGMYGMLLGDNFIRVNRSCIINTNFVSSFDKENKQVNLLDGSSIKISRRRWELVFNRLTA
jgi:DNA-binding LytR/AlgR family response regulator